MELARGQAVEALLEAVHVERGALLVIGGQGRPEPVEETPPPVIATAEHLLDEVVGGLLAAQVAQPVEPDAGRKTSKKVGFLGLAGGHAEKGGMVDPFHAMGV